MKSIALIMISYAIVTSQANMKIGFGNVRNDIIAGDVVIESGEIPLWLEGTFYRLSCGSFGETGSTASKWNRVEHLFDCISVAQTYQFENGLVTFNQRYFDSATTDIWRAYDMNMNDSLVFWRPVFSGFDFERQQIIQPIMDHSGKIERMPEVTLWQMNGQVYSHSEYEGVVQVYPHDMQNEVQFHQFDDDNFGYTNEIIIDEDAHEVQEADGTLYCTHMVYQFDQYGALHQWKNVFKVKDNVRSTVARIPYPDIDLSACSQDDVSVTYPTLSHRQGYMHSIAMTERYLVIPESSYLAELCALFVNNQPDVALYKQFFTWEQEAPSRIWVIRKSDGRIMANLTTEPVFITHQFNAYEEGGFIYADMVTFNNSDPYTNYTFVQQLIDGGLEAHDVYRYIIDMSDWSLRRSNLLPGQTGIEFPNINQDYIGKPYTYAWSGVNVYSPRPNALAKINVQTGQVVEQYDFAPGFYAFEPWFVKTPTSSSEDDGVIMVQGLDSMQEKGFLMIFDARNLSRICHVTGTDLVLYGLHNKFFTPHIGSLNSSSAPESTASFPGDGALERSASYVVILMIAVFYLIT